MFAANLLRRQAKMMISRTNCIPTRSKANFKDGGQHATFNDMPIPQGCWHEDYARKQHRYMKVLLSGIGSFIGSVIFVVASGEMEFNCTVPDYPYDDKEENY